MRVFKYSQFGTPIKQLVIERTDQKGNPTKEVGGGDTVSRQIIQDSNAAMRKIPQPEDLVKQQQPVHDSQQVQRQIKSMRKQARQQIKEKTVLTDITQRLLPLLGQLNPTAKQLGQIVPHKSKNITTKMLKYIYKGFDSLPGDAKNEYRKIQHQIFMLQKQLAQSEGRQWLSALEFRYLPAERRFAIAEKILNKHQKRIPKQKRSTEMSQQQILYRIQEGQRRFQQQQEDRFRQELERFQQEQGGRIQQGFREFQHAHQQYRAQQREDLRKQKQLQLRADLQRQKQLQLQQQQHMLQRQQDIAKRRQAILRQEAKQKLKQKQSRQRQRREQQLEAQRAELEREQQEIIYEQQRMKKSRPRQVEEEVKQMPRRQIEEMQIPRRQVEDFLEQDSERMSDTSRIMGRPQMDTSPGAETLVFKIPSFKYPFVISVFGPKGQRMSSIQKKYYVTYDEQQSMQKLVTPYSKFLNRAKKRAQYIVSSLITGKKYLMVFQITEGFDKVGLTKRMTASQKFKTLTPPHKQISMKEANSAVQVYFGQRKNLFADNSYPLFELMVVSKNWEDLNGILNNRGFIQLLNEAMQNNEMTKGLGDQQFDSRFVFQEQGTRYELEQRWNPPNNAQALYEYAKTRVKSSGRKDNQYQFMQEILQEQE